MAATIVATVGASSANSYVTLSAANSFMDERLNVDEWTDATTDERNRALITAARRLDQETYAGLIADDGQALQWPRSDVYDKNGYLYSNTEIPQEIKDAQCVLALALLADDLLADTGLEAFESVKVGSLDVVPRVRTAGALPADVLREIAHLLESPNPYQFRMVRG